MGLEGPYLGGSARGYLSAHNKLFGGNMTFRPKDAPTPLSHYPWSSPPGRFASIFHH